MIDYPGALLLSNLKPYIKNLNKFWAPPPSPLTYFIWDGHIKIIGLFAL